MTKTVVLLGGNGYIGRAVTEAWNAKYPDTKFFAVSRSGMNKLNLPNLENVKLDLTNEAEVQEKLPEHFDFIVDLIGGPIADAVESKKQNDDPAHLMQKLSESHGATAMGMIGGLLGPKYFVQTKARLIKELSQSKVPLAYVEPTLVYGNGLSDKMSKMVPLLKIGGLFSAKLKPVEVTKVASDLVASFEAVTHNGLK